VRQLAAAFLRRKLASGTGSSKLEPQKRSRKAGPHSKALRQHDRPPRARKPLDSLAFEGMWGEPWSLAADGEATRGI